MSVKLILTFSQRVLHEIRVWSTLFHENIAPLLGHTHIFDAAVSLVSPWNERGNAHDYVQDRIVDPRPVVSRSTALPLMCSRT